MREPGLVPHISNFSDTGEKAGILHRRAKHTPGPAVREVEGGAQWEQKSLRAQLLSHPNKVRQQICNHKWELQLAMHCHSGHKRSCCFSSTFQASYKRLLWSIISPEPYR